MRVIGNLLLLALITAVAWLIYREFTYQPLGLTIPYQLEADQRVDRSQLYLFKPKTLADEQATTPQIQTPKTMAATTSEKQQNDVVGASIEYVLSQSPKKLWLSSIILLKDVSGSTILHDFQLQLQTLDSDNQLIAEHDLSFGARVADQITLENRVETIPEFFTVDANTQVGAPENIYIAIAPDVKKVKITLLEKSNDIANIGLRLYQRVERNTRLNPLDTWERLSNSQQNKLTEYNLYGPKELSEQEKSNLAKLRWQPVIPLGTPAEDYILSALFRIPNDIILNKSSLLETQQNITDYNQHVTFPIHTEGEYSLIVNHLFSKRPYSVTITWHGMQSGEAYTQKYDLSETTESLTFNLRKGLFDVKSSIPAAVELMSETETIYEHAHYVPAFLIDQQHPLEFAVVHSNHQQTPIRLSLHQYTDTQLDTTSLTSTAPPKLSEAQLKQHGQKATFVAPNISIELIDNNGKTWQTKTLNSNSQAAKYYQLNNAEFFNWLSDKQDLYINVPRHIETIRVSTNAPHLIRMATRPTNIPSIRWLPQQSRDWFDFEERTPDWFGLYPSNKNEFVNQGRAATIKYYHQPIQPHLPTTNETAEKSFESLLSNRPELILSEIMTPIVFSTFPQSKAPATFSPLQYWQMPAKTHSPASTATSPIRCTLANAKSQPKLFFVQNIDIKDKVTPQQIQWAINGIAQPPFWIASHWGIVELPTPILPAALTTAPEHSLEIQIDEQKNITWYSELPNIEQQITSLTTFDPKYSLTLTGLQKRRVVALKPTTPLTVKLRKDQAIQTLSMFVYPVSNVNHSNSEQAIPTPVELLLEIMTVNTHKPLFSETYTISKRKLIIEPQRSQFGYKLSSTETIMQNQFIPITLNGDIPEGEVLLKISILNDTEAYLNITQPSIAETPVIRRSRQ